MDAIHLCLSDLIDQDLSAYEYYQSLPRSTQNLLDDREISSFEEMLENVARIRASELYH